MSFISTIQPASSTTKGPKPHQFRPQPQSAAGINCRETRKLHRHSTTTTSTNCISPARKPPSAAANPTQNNTKRSTTAAAVSRTIYTFNLLALILTLFTSISPLLLFLSSAHAAPLPGPARPHATAGLLELTPPPFPNSTHHSAVSNSISSPTTTLYTTSTATLTLTRTIAPSASGRARRPAPTNQPDSSNPHRPPRASPAAAAQHRKGGQVVLDAADKPRVGKEGGAGHGSEGAQVDGSALGEERPAQEKAAAAPKIDLRKRGEKSEEGKGEMGVHEILKLMAGIREKRAVKAGPGSHKRKPQKRAEVPASRAQASEAPRPTQNVGVGRQVPMQMVAGRRDRRPSQMLLSNLLVQKIPGTAWGGYAAMPDGGL